MVRAFIFDLDGTLLTTEALWVQATEEYLRGLGVAISHEDAVAMVYGRSWHDIYPDLVKRMPGGGLPRPDVEEAMAPIYYGLRGSRDIRIPSSIALLERLAREYPVCIVSGSSRKEVALGVELMGVGDALRFFLGAEDYSPGKPDPICYLKAAAKLAVPPAECLVFEDSWAGVQAAKRAGMVCIALSRNGCPDQDLSGADVVFADLADFELSRFQ